MKKIVLLLLFLVGCIHSPVTVDPEPTYAVMLPVIMPAVSPTVTARALPTPTRSPSPTPAICTVKTGWSDGTVYIREGPGMTYPVVGVAREGDHLRLSGPLLQGWRAVKSPEGVDGFFYVGKWCGGIDE